MRIPPVNRPKSAFFSGKNESKSGRILIFSAKNGSKNGPTLIHSGKNGPKNGCVLTDVHCDNQIASTRQCRHTPSLGFWLSFSMATPPGSALNSASTTGFDMPRLAPKETPLKVLFPVVK